MENDIKNYLEHKITKCKIFITETAIPRYFDCQGRKYASTPKQRQAFLKINRKREVEQILLDAANEQRLSKIAKKWDQENIKPLTSSSANVAKSSNFQPNNINETKDNFHSEFPETFNCPPISLNDELDETGCIKFGKISAESVKKIYCNFATQTPKLHFRSKYIQCQTKTKDAKVGFDTPLFELVDNCTQTSCIENDAISKKSSL